MAELIMKQKALSIKESYEIYSGTDLKYFIKRRKLITKKPAFDVFTEDGVVASAEVVNTTAPLIFKLIIGEKEVGEVRYDETPGVNKLIYEEKGITIDGNSILSEFSIKDSNKKIIGTIKKKIVSVGDTYDISFENDEDELFFTLLALIVDESFHG